MKDVIMTPCGPIRGVQSRNPGVTAYKGIRYATAQRWKHPEIVTHWEGIYEADHYGHCSYQPRAFYNEEENLKKIFYYHEFRKGETYTYSEDCLFLNIFTPDTAKPGDDLPVLLYIHGGGFTGGCGHEKHFDEPVWPKKGVIAVTINYRLGPMGFVCLPQLQEEAGACGNYGLYDQLCAMRWVRENIAAFGGDPEAITIMGQSAGAMSVQQHCLSPLSEGMFRGAVMSSGGGVSGLMKTRPAESSFDFWKLVMEKAGCSDLAAFRALAPEKLFAAWDIFFLQDFVIALPAFPVPVQAIHFFDECIELCGRPRNLGPSFHRHLIQLRQQRCRADRRIGIVSILPDITYVWQYRINGFIHSRIIFCFAGFPLAFQTIQRSLIPNHLVGSFSFIQPVIFFVVHFLTSSSCIYYANESVQNSGQNDLKIRSAKIILRIFKMGSDFTPDFLL